MKYATGLVALATTVLALPQGVTETLLPSTPAPAGCSASAPGSFNLQVVNVSSTPAKVKRQQAGTLVLTLQDGIMKDQAGRQAYIAANDQWQFDQPIQAGAKITAGFSLCANNSIALGGSAIWWQCLSGSFYNLYSTKQGNQCNEVYFEAINMMNAMTGMPGATPAPSVASQISDGQPQASPVSQISDGQPQAATGKPVSQISDGQPQAPTGMPVTQISDGQPQAPTGKPVTQISDGQPQAPVATGKPVSQISDGQPQAPTGKPVSQISDGQPQAPTGKPVSQISDGQPQAPTGMPVSQISDGQPQAPTGKPVSQISDGQPQAPTGAPAPAPAPAPTGAPVSQISDGQPQAPTGKPVSQISDGQPQAPTGNPVSQISDGQVQAATGSPSVSAYAGSGSHIETSLTGAIAAVLMGVAAML